MATVVIVDLEKAFAYYKNGMNRGDDISTFNCAIMLKQGKGCEQNKEDAICLFKLRAKNGYDSSMYEYGCKLIKGEGVQMNNKE